MKICISKVNCLRNSKSALNFLVGYTILELLTKTMFAIFGVSNASNINIFSSELDLATAEQDYISQGNL